MGLGNLADLLRGCLAGPIIATCTYVIESGRQEGLLLQEMSADRERNSSSLHYGGRHGNGQTHSLPSSFSSFCSREPMCCVSGCVYSTSSMCCRCLLLLITLLRLGHATAT